MSRVSNQEVQSTRIRMMDACIAKRAKLIDCNTCSHQVTCDFIWQFKLETGKKEIPDEEKLIELAERFFN